MGGSYTHRDWGPLLPKQEEVPSAAGCPIFLLTGHSSRLLRVPDNTHLKNGLSLPLLRILAAPGVRPSSHLPCPVPGPQGELSHPLHPLLLHI